MYKLSCYFIRNTFLSDALSLFPLTSARLASLLLLRRPTLSLVQCQSYTMNSISFQLKVGVQSCINCNAVLCETHFLSDALLLFPQTSARPPSLLLLRRPTLSLVLRQSYKVNSISFHLKVGVQLCINCHAILYETPFLSDALLLFPINFCSPSVTSAPSATTAKPSATPVLSC